MVFQCSYGHIIHEEVFTGCFLYTAPALSSCGWLAILPLLKAPPLMCFSGSFAYAHGQFPRMLDCASTAFKSEGIGFELYRDNFPVPTICKAFMKKTLLHAMLQ